MSNIFTRLTGMSPEQRARLRSAAGGTADSRLTGRPRPDGLAPASYTQEQLWFLDRLSDHGPAAYLVPFALRLRGPLDVPTLSGALDRVVARHDVLRSHFTVRDGDLWQVSAPDVAVPLAVEVLDTPDEAAVWRRARQLAAERLAMDTAPLVRATLLRVTETDHVLVWIAHHAVADGTSVRVLLDELAAIYRAALVPGSPEPEPLSLQYSDFAEWQRERLTAERLGELLDYWRGHLSGAPAAVLPADRPRPAGQTFRGDCVPFRLPAEVSRSVADLAVANGTTVFVVLLAALQAVLARYTGEPDAVLGAALSGRTLAEVEPLIGPFATTVPLRVDAGGDPTFTTLVGRVAEVVLDGLTHQEVPFGELVRGLGQARDASRNPLYQVLFSMDALASGETELADGLTVAATGLPNGTARLDLQLTVQAGDVLSGRLDYSTDLYDDATAESFVRAFTTFVAAAVREPDLPLAAVSLLGTAERHRVLDRWRRPALAQGPLAGFPRRFADRVRAEPDRTALVCGPVSLTYRELDEAANRVAHTVRAHGGGRGVVVAVGLERTPALLPVLLGVLRSGSACLPLDPSFPTDRLSYVLTDSHAALLLREPGGLEWATDLLTTVDVGVGPAGPMPGAPATQVEDEPTLADVAYVMYTSGSTGRPKGVVVGHRALGNFLDAMTGLGLMRRDDSVVALTNVTFDISVDELFLPLVAGATVVLATKEQARNGAALRELVEDHGVTVLHGTPATCRLLVESGWTGGAGAAGAVRR